jgi:hypothetical protein
VLPDLSPELKSNIVKALSAGEKPMAAPAILKALPVGGRPKPKVFGELLAQLEREGVLVSVPSRSRKYVPGPIDVWVRRAVLKALATAPQPEAKLLKLVTAANAEVLANVLASLRAQEEIHVHPPLTKSGKPSFGLSPADPIPYIAKDVDKLLTAAVKKGFSMAELRDALIRYLGHGTRTPAAETIAVEEIIASMRLLDPRVDHGAAVPIGKLRESLAEKCSKQEFDRVLVELSASGRLELQSHAWPERLSEQERAMLIANGRGGWFDSVALGTRSQS